MKKIAFGLVRVSTSEQDMQSQKDSLLKKAKEFGYDIPNRYFFEEKISGYDEDIDFDRDSIVRLREECSLHKPDAIFILELSRLTRRAIKVYHYIDVLSIGPKIPMYFADYDIWTIEKGRINDNGIQELIGGAKGVEMERERIKARTSRGRDAKAEKGYYVGHLKDGYIWQEQNGEKVIVIDKEREPVIKLIFDLYGNKGYTSADVMDYLNVKGIPTTNRYRLEHPSFFKGYKETYVDKHHQIRNRKDTLWTDGLVCAILRDEWYIGKRKYHQKEYPVDAIIDKDLWDKVQEQLTQAKTITAIKNRPSYLLTGLLFCGKCGRKLYAHGDGYSNMYYCSSKENGKSYTCGLRWIRQENLDSIVLSIIKERAFQETQYGEKSVVSDFFSIDKQQLSEIKTRINTLQATIERAESEKNKKNQAIQFYLGQQAKYFDKPNMMDNIQANIDEANEEIEALNQKISQQRIKLESLQKKLTKIKSTKNKLNNIKQLDDFDTAKEFAHSVIQKIVLYNPDEKTTFIRIKYNHGKEDTAIYCPTRLKKNFVFFSFDELSEHHEFQYDEDSGCFSWPNNYIIINPNSDEFVPFDELFRAEGSERVLTAEEYVNLKTEKEGGSIYIEKVPVVEYVELKRRSEFLIPFTDILPLSEKGVIKKKYWQEWYKRKYITGKPSFTPFIVKDDTYEDIQKKRKHLYNRKYKILNNKHLSQEQKEEQLFRIEEQLDAFKYQIKYLPTNKKGVQCLEKYSKTNE